MRKAWDEIAKLRGPLGGTKVVAAARSDIDRLYLEAGLEVIGGGAGFRGQVETLRGGDLRVTYDFRKNPSSLEDFEDVMTVSAIIRRKGNVISGTGSVCHRAAFTGDLRIEVEGAPVSDHDFGIVMVDRDSKKPRFLVAALNNTFFGVKYGEDRRISPGHLLVFCGPGAESRAKENPSQILAQRPSTPGTLEKDSDLQMSLSCRKHQVSFAAGPASLATSLATPGKQLTRCHIGIHLHRSTFRVDRVVIEGRLDADWSKHEVENLRARLR
jgi:hypothetical protein